MGQLLSPLHLPPAQDSDTPSSALLPPHSQPGFQHPGAQPPSLPSARARPQPPSWGLPATRHKSLWLQKVASYCESQVPPGWPPLPHTHASPSFPAGHLSSETITPPLSFASDPPPVCGDQTSDIGWLDWQSSGPAGGTSLGLHQGPRRAHVIGIMSPARPPVRAVSPATASLGHPGALPSS